jgi:hypothetical protein
VPRNDGNASCNEGDGWIASCLAMTGMASCNEGDSWIASYLAMTGMACSCGGKGAGCSSLRGTKQSRFPACPCPCRGGEEAGLGWLDCFVPRNDGDGLSLQGGARRQAWDGWIASCLAMTTLCLARTALWIARTGMVCLCEVRSDQVPLPAHVLTGGGVRRQAGMAGLLRASQ